MKKDYLEKYLYLYSGFAFLWHQCNKCKKAVKFERMWRALIGPFRQGCGRWSYLCIDCCPTRQEADSYYLNRKYISPTPRPSNIGGCK